MNQTQQVQGIGMAWSDSKDFSADPACLVALPCFEQAHGPFDGCGIAFRWNGLPRDSRGSAHRQSQALLQEPQQSHG